MDQLTAAKGAIVHMDQYIGRLLDGRYEILEIIGTGGMAVVYKARCHRLNRLVAIKILKDEYAKDEEFRRRFRAEGQAVAMLSHPNIVQVFDVSSSDNANFIVMELIDGISLKQYMEKKGSLNWKETLHFAMQIAAGLEHAHSRGIIHRDIKPHNVMVLKNGSVKVMDFGIARVMSKSNTLTKEALGSVHYISPEQAKGSYTDNRSDLYSLSVVMYEMTTGRPPYDGESPVAVAIQHINGGAAPPSVLNPNIPRGLEQIIQKGMALDVKDRYSSATEMLRDMEEFRKNPSIVFDYESQEPTPRSAISNPQAPITTAERVVMQKTGVRPSQEAGRSRSTPARKRSESESKSRSPESQRRKQERGGREEERSRVAAAAIVVCSAVAVISICVFLAALFNGALLNQEKELVEVPNLVGNFFSDDLSGQYADFTFRFQPQEYSDQYQKGQIMRQEPVGGSRVVKGTEIVLTVSMGEEPQVKVMENLVGVTQEEARSFLENQGFLPLVRNETNSIYDAGVVIRTEPSAGTELTPGQTVKLWVSIGPEIILQKMPDVIGMELDIALRVLDQVGFKNIRTREVSSDAAPGSVVYQSVKKDEEVDITSEILLEYAAIPEETTDSTTEATQEELISQFVSFDLPVREEPYDLTIYLDGILVMEPSTIEPGTNSLTLELKGRGEQKYDLYINDVLYSSKTVEFG